MTTDSSYQDALAALMAFVEEDDRSAGEEPGGLPTVALQQGWEPALPEAPQEPEEETPVLYYGSVDEFVREVILPFYQRKVGARGSRRWSAEWWRNAEAVSRLDALWRSWEHLRQDGQTGMSAWWRDHADYHMERLLDPEGPFGRSEDENKPGTPLPYTPPPAGLFTDARS